MAHIVNPVHLLPGSLRFFADDTEKRGYRKKMILNDMQIFNKMKDFGLTAS